MGIKYTLYTFLLAVLFCGLAFALLGATPTRLADIRWSGNAAGNLITEGGNISAVNIDSVSLTDKWAAFFGNVSGTINLTDGTSNLYSWAWTAASGGKVCLSEGTVPFGAYATTTANQIDTEWGFITGSADNANNTFITSECNMTFALGQVNDTANVTHKSGSFTTCALTIGGTAKNNHFFCTSINNAGTAFNGEAAHYEVMVPTTTYGNWSDTYYFFTELD